MYARQYNITASLILLMMTAEFSDFFIFIFLLRENGGGAIQVYVEQIQACLGAVFVLKVFRLSFASDFFNLLLAKSHQAEINN